MGVVTVGRLLADYHDYQRAIPKIIILLMLTAGTGILASLLVIALLCAGYLALVDHGLSYHIAFLIVTMCLAATVAAGFILISQHIKKLRQTLQPLSPLGEGISDVVTAFADGFRRS